MNNLIALIIMGLIIISFMFYGLVNNYKDDQLENTTIGGQKDPHDCFIAAGYSWNESDDKCVREWETNESLRYQRTQEFIE